MGEGSNLAVNLCNNDKLLMSGSAKNISLRGMLIVCDSSLVHVGGVYETNFELEIKGFIKKYKISVLVNRAIEGGVIVEFSKFDQSTFCSIRDMMMWHRAGL